MGGKSRAHSSKPIEIGQITARRFLNGVLQLEKTSIPKLAKSAGVAASTLYRILDEDDPFTTSMRTIEKIERATGHSIAEAATGFAEPEARFVSAEEAPAEIRPGDNEGVWRLGSRIAELAGFLPGDLVLFEIGAEPAAGELVVANIEDRAGGAETVMRIFDPPYLITRTFDAALALKPVLVDGESVRIMGRFKRMLRARPVPQDNG